jgi:transposase
MFVRAKTTPNSPRKSIQVVENVRDPKTGKVKQKILRHVGIAMNEEEEAKLRQIALDIIARLQREAQESTPQLSLFPAELDAHAASLPKSKGRKPKKQLHEILPVSQVSLDMIVEEARLIDGVHEVAGHLYEEINYSSLLRNQKYNRILKDLVLCRISNPSSKLATSQQLKRYYHKEHDIDAIYRTMDHVFSRIDKMKQTTFQSTLSLIPGKVDILLFDVTTLYFESTDVDELRCFGYSKDFRFNTTQVVLALATNSDGLPVGYELFEGNKAEVKTLIDTLESWKKLFNIEQVCFIGDRAMFSADNLNALDERGYSYIVAAKLRGLPDVMQQKVLHSQNYIPGMVDEDFCWINEFHYEEADIEWLRQQGAKPKEIQSYQKKIAENQHRKFVVSYSSKRARCDAKKRDLLLDKIKKQLNKTADSARLISNTALKKYTHSEGQSKTSIDSQKVETDQGWDGLHGVITNLKDARLAHILSEYKRLLKIEDCFRVNKTTLKMRPIYHFKPERIHAHVAICYMAFALIRQLEYRVKLIKKLSIDSIIEELNSVQSSIYIHKITKDRYRVPGNFSNEARKIYSALNIKRNLDAYPIF